jgi:hypothetical protein
MKYFCLIMLSVWMMNPANLVAQSYENSVNGDHRALMDIYHATDGDNWYNNDGWGGPPETMGSWWGVATDSNGRVVHLDLQRGTKSMPAERSNPSPETAGNNLKNADSKGNLIPGREFPESIGNLTKLKYLNLKQNVLRGPIPKGITNLSSAERILLSGHPREPEVRGSNHPVVSSSGKKDQSTNFWEGELPDNIDRLQSLVVWESIQSGLGGNLPVEFGSLPNLAMIMLSYQDETVGGFTGTLPVEWANATNLKNIDITRSKLEGFIPPEWGNLQLSHIKLGGNNLEGPIPTTFANFVDMGAIHLGNNNLSGPFPSFLLQGNRNPFIDTILLNGNNFSGEIPEIDLSESETGYRHISVLNIHLNQFEGQIPKWITELRLVQMDWSFNNFSGQLPAEFSDPLAMIHERMRYMRVNSNKLEGSLPDVSWSNSLLSLRFDNNNFSGSIPESWGDISTNRSLSIRLDKNSLSGTIPLKVANLSISGGEKLTLVDISENKFSQPEIDPFKEALLDKHPEVDFKYSGQKPSGSSGDGGEGEEGSSDDSDRNRKGPKKSSPSNNEKNVSKKPTFKWESVEGADSYTIEVSSAETSLVLIEEEVYDTLFTPDKEFQPNSKYNWRVRANINGEAAEWSDNWEFTTESDNREFEFETELSQNYPNPFNPSTQIRFTLTDAQQVSLKVYDMAGRLVANLVDRTEYSAGTYEVTFNANSLASGIYFYRFITEREIVTRKMTLMK